MCRNIYLNLGLHILNGVRGLNLEGDGLPGQGLDEDLHDETFFVAVLVRICCNSVCVELFCVTEVVQASWQLFIGAWSPPARKLAQLARLSLVGADKWNINRPSHWLHFAFLSDPLEASGAFCCYGGYIWHDFVIFRFTKYLKYILKPLWIRSSLIHFK